MASLQVNIQDLATRVATECKALRTLINGNAANLSGLNTTAKSNLVAAINEVESEAAAAAAAASAAQSTANTGVSDAASAQSTANAANNAASTAQTAADNNASSIGTLSSLTTTAKSTLVAAINELQAEVNAATTTANTADSEIGTLASLTTTAKSNLVAAINELEAAISSASGIDDGVTGTSTTWSSTKIASELVAAVDGATRFQGGWSAASGSFPSGATLGDLYKVTTAGTVNGVSFSVGDSLYAEVANPSTTTYANNWVKIDSTDAVTSVAGKTGAVTLVKADITDFNAYVPGGTDVPITDGGTGASSKVGAQANLGIVDSAAIGNPDTNFVTGFEAGLV